MSDNQRPRSRRRLVRMVLTIIVLALLGAAGAWWYVEYGQWVESTDNAYVQGNLVSLSARVPGEIVFLGAEENDRVEAGDVLARLATGDARRGLDEASHMLAFAVREIRTRRAKVKTARSELKLKQTSHRLAQQEFERRQKLLTSNMVSQEELDAARTRAEETAVELQTARNELDEAVVQAGEGALDEHPMIKVASARFRDAWRLLGKHTTYARVSGRIARRTSQVGQVVAAGTPLYTIAEADNLWIEANFKETQLVNLRPGQPVEIVSDVYGSDHVYKGVISSIGAGTGATFSVLPPQNATGNWIKIVQRVPVRVDFVEPPGPAYPLVIGASLEVRVDTHQRGDARPLALGNIGRVSENAHFEDLNDGANAAIAKIIADSLAQQRSSSD